MINLSDGVGVKHHPPGVELFLLLLGLNNFFPAAWQKQIGCRGVAFAEDDLVLVKS